MAPIAQKVTADLLEGLVWTGQLDWRSCQLTLCNSVTGAAILAQLLNVCSDPWPPDTDPSPGGHAGHSPIAAVEDFKDLGPEAVRDHNSLLVEDFCRSRGVEGKDVDWPWLVGHVEAIHSSLTQSQHLTLSGQPSLRLPSGGPIGAAYKVT